MFGIKPRCFQNDKIVQLAVDARARRRPDYSEQLGRISEFCGDAPVNSGTAMPRRGKAVPIILFRPALAFIRPPARSTLRMRGPITDFIDGALCAEEYPCRTIPPALLH
jgi:hypothetical protein